MKQIVHVGSPIPEDEIREELGRAEAKFPLWPVDAIHGAAIVAEEAGEVVKAALHFSYDSGHIDDLRSELIQTAAMAIRFLAFIEKHRVSIFEE